MKPDWKDAPEWANYLAMDGNGRWWWYLEQPIWHEGRGRWIYGENVAPASGYAKPPSETLELRP